MSELSKDEYEALLAPLSIELSEMARWVAETGQRLVVLFEGRDTAGKGTTIYTIAARSTRANASAVALAAPTEREIGQWYFQRYVAHLPAKGEIVLFDRSWYNRAGRRAGDGILHRRGSGSVPRCRAGVRKTSRRAWHLALQILADLRSGRSRSSASSSGSTIPVKRWKISPVDIEARTRYDEYTEARERMLKATHTRIMRRGPSSISTTSCSAG